MASGARTGSPEPDPGPGGTGAGEVPPSAGSDEVSPTRAIPSGGSGRSAAPFAGTYRIVRELGRGGMAVVYEAEQERPRRPVALKVLTGAAALDETRQRLFQREVQALARLKHPGIGAIYESGSTDDGRAYFAMELVRGETLKEHLAKENALGPLTPSRLASRLRLFRRICEAVAYAHQRGIVHRDLKPSNVLVPPPPAPDPGGTSDREVKVLDFGLARIADADPGLGTVVTRLGEVYGTPPYMSPEQFRGNPDEVDTRTDVYALGVILYEMLAGRVPLPVAGRTFVAAARIVCEDVAPPLAKGWLGTRRPDADLETIVAKALEKEPARRYQSVSTLLDDVDRFLASRPISARPPSALYQLRKAIARHRVGFAFAATVLALVVCGAVAMAFLSARVARERDRAEREAARANAINAFLLETLGSANPVEGRSRDVRLLDALRLASEKVGEGFASQPDLQGRVLGTLGQTYLRLGEYPEAETALRGALAALRRAGDTGSPDLVSVLNALALARQERGDLAEADALYREAIAATRATLPSPSEQEVALLNNLSQLRLDRGDLPGAEALCREVLALDRKLGGPEGLGVAIDLNNLGTILVRRRRLAEAEPVLREAFALLRKASPASAFMAAGNLGEALTATGRAAEAEPLLAAAVAEGLRGFGEKSQDVAKTRVKHGECLLALGRPAEAEEPLRSALAVFRESLGEGDPWVRRSARGVADVCAATGRAEEAERLRALAGTDPAG